MNPGESKNYRLRKFFRVRVHSKILRKFRSVRGARGGNNPALEKSNLCACERA